MRHLMASIAGPKPDLTQIIIWKALEYWEELQSLTRLPSSSYLTNLGLIRETGRKGISLINFFEMKGNAALYFQRELEYWQY